MLLFTLGAIVVAAGLGFLAAHAPARVRLLGLFSIGFGLLTGWLLSGLAARLRLPVRRAQVAVIAIATLAGLITSVCRTVLLQPANPKADSHPLTEMVEAQLRKPADAIPPVPTDAVPSDQVPTDAAPLVPVPPAPVQPPPTPPPPVLPPSVLKSPLLQSQPRTFTERLQTYLNRRVEMLGNWPTPWPELFWALELSLGTAGAVWIATRYQPREVEA